MSPSREPVGLSLQRKRLPTTTETGFGLANCHAVMQEWQISIETRRTLSNFLTSPLEPPLQIWSFRPHNGLQLSECCCSAHMLHLLVRAAPLGMLLVTACSNVLTLSDCGWWRLLIAQGAQRSPSDTNYDFTRQVLFKTAINRG